MSQFLDWCVGEGELAANPWEALKVKDRPEVHPHGMLTDDTGQRIAQCQGQGAAQCTALRAPHRHALWGDLWAHGGGHHSKGEPGALCQHQAQQVRLLKSKAAEREVPLHGVLEELLDTASANLRQAVPAPQRGQGREALCLPSAASSRAARAPCSTPPASGSSPSVSAQVSLSTSPQLSWGITPRGPPIS